MAADHDCPYAVLGVRDDAKPEEIRTAYRARLKLAHPDGGGSRGELETVIRAFRACLALVRIEKRSERTPKHAGLPNRRRRRPRLGPASSDSAAP